MSHQAGAAPVRPGPPRHVLVATDLSGHAERAVCRAAALAAEHGAVLTAVHVTEPDLDPALPAHAGDRLRAQLDRCAEAVERHAVVRSGSIVAELLDEAGVRGADLLVVGAHGGHRRTGSLLGGIPQDLVRASDVPVLVVRTPSGVPYGRVLLAVGASTSSFTAAGTGIALTPDAEHLLVHAITVPGEHLLLMRGMGEHELEQLRGASEERARTETEHRAAGLVPPPAHVLVTPGRAEDAVPELADRYGAGLVVVGTGARHGRLGRALLGGVARHVMQEAVCDVLVVPPAPHGG
ncbi:universal stress protein [Streptomyces sp. F63]|uniref:universal stress protein n=1 Tax=Streptomyces sp. F63 TaxID=2824887 RepID=UPI001B35BBA8|nr:universal stress protein [Streptomyces sp. F63]MBQ0983368.1 universal stress protein [Streptomyces sp. F63]